MNEFLKSTDEITAAYVALRTSVLDLIRRQPASARDIPVPHCPAWTAGDVLAHMVGVPEDILAGRLDGVTTESWTQAHVDRHRNRSLEQLAKVWDQTAETFDTVLSSISAPVNSQVVLDAVTHEHDLRHALGTPGGRNQAAVSVAVGWILNQADQESPGLAGQLLAFGLGDFDLLRVATGRRSRDQIAELGIDPELVEGLLDNTPLSMPHSTIRE